jgi:hypothetical protein
MQCAEQKDGVRLPISSAGWRDQQQGEQQQWFE